MPNLQLNNRSDIPKEPNFNCSDEAVSPVKVCALTDEEKEPKQKIKKVFFANLEGSEIKKISKEKEIYLVIETENMNGEEVIIDIPKKKNFIFRYNGENITEDKVLKLSVGSNLEKIKLEVIPKRKKFKSGANDGNNDGNVLTSGKESSDKKSEEGKKKKQEEKEEVKKDKELKRIVFKRKKILWGEILGITEESGRDQYGHWWVEIDKTESYGWWPVGQVDFTGTIKGVPGSLNRGNTKDPHHGEDADQEFSPVIDKDDTRTTDEIIACIRSFAKNYGDTHENWSYPAIGSNTANCQSFQKEMIQHCKITKKGKVTHKDTNGNITNTDAVKGDVEEVYD